MHNARLRKAATQALVFLVLCVPYTLGLLLTRPVAMRLAAEGFLLRSLVFFQFFICLHALIWALRSLYGFSTQETSHTPQTKESTSKENRPAKKVRGKASKKNSPEESAADKDRDLSEKVARPPKRTQLIRTVAVLLSGAFCLFLLAYAERTYNHIPGATNLLMVLFGAFPLLEVVKQRRQWRLYLPLLIATQSLVAFTSLVVHFADSFSGVLTIGLLSISYEQVAAGLNQLIPPVLLALVAGCIGSIGALFSTTEQLTSEHDLIWLERLKTAMLVLLFIPAPLVALLAYFSILPPLFRYAYLGIAIVVVVGMRFRSDGVSRAGFRLAALAGALLTYCYILTLALWL